MLPPTLPLPESLHANEAGTFAEDSVVRRLPEIARRTIAENRLDSRRIDLVEELACEIPDATLTLVDEPEAPDAADWASYIEPYLSANWLDAPWFLVETYFYRRLLAATGYSQPGERCGVDPFAQQKALALDGAIDLAGRLGEALDEPWALLGASLWSNQVDLSLWPACEAGSDARPNAVLALGRETHHLVNDTKTALDQLERAGSVHFVLDNAGAELVADLTLAAAVLQHGGEAVIHAKPHPTFVSDATLKDLDSTITRLASTNSSAARIADVLVAARRQELLRFTTHPFWVSPLPFWECPSDLVSELRNADLIIVKGDANYRRLLGDLHWDPTTPFSSIVRPPAPLVALRTAKSEVMAGVSRWDVDRARNADPDWMVNGQWGLIQYAPATS
jgi:uncharacterized protein with ATP-grasp and redox domains